MAHEQYQDYITPLLTEFNTKLRDIEEKQRLLKDRVLLIGTNLVEMREEMGKDLTDLKVQSEQAKQDILKIRETLQRLAEELENRARRAEIDLIKRQFKIFEPLKLARLEDVERMINEKLNK
ncbi:MAG: hypothetical protein KKB21_03900 [Nanoarchaeota archaeon]|nr:hypothetical protein [Nanoarchaeota archaeon]MBU4086691.1 hypothetical protein [Nanoarchaeota archaeon]